MDVIRSESERSRFLPDYLSVLKEFFNDFFSLNSKNEIILGQVFEKIKNFGKSLSPSFSKNFLSRIGNLSKSGKQKVFYTIFTMNEHE